MLRKGAQDAGNNCGRARERNGWPPTICRPVAPERQFIADGGYVEVANVVTGNWRGLERRNPR